MTDTVLVRKSLADIFVFWAPGSHDWSWAEEYLDVMSHERTAKILDRVQKEGIDFQDDIAPVLLGSDGRVWDGHHRICLALKLGLTHLNVEMANANSTA